MLVDGRWSENLIGINVRKYLFIAIFILFLIYTAFNKIKRYVFLISLPIAILFTVWALLIPSIYDTDLKYSTIEAFPLFGFMLLSFSVIFFKRNIPCWLFIRNFIFILSAVNCFIHLIIVLGFYFDQFNFLSISYLDFVDPERLGSISLTFSEEETRIVWTGSIFFLIVFSKAFFSEKKNYFLQFTLLSLSASTLIITSSRGFYIGIIISLILIFFMKITKLFDDRKNLYIGTVFLIIFSMFVTAAPISTYFFDLVGWTRSISDETRVTQGAALFDEILNYPIFGKGFGATTINFPRPINEPFSFELYLLSLVMKVGLFGSFFCWLIYFLFRYYFDGPKSEKNCFVVGRIRSQYTFLFVAIIIISSSNPYLLNSAGFLFIFYIANDYAIFNQNNENIKSSIII